MKYLAIKFYVGQEKILGEKKSDEVIQSESKAFCETNARLVLVVALLMIVRPLQLSKCRENSGLLQFKPLSNV